MSAFDQTPLRPDAPAMPTSQEIFGGLTARQHAAIALCVPDSGTQWLDDMIRARLRDEFAAKAMQATLSNPNGYETPGPVADYAFSIADAMLAARQKGASHD